MADARRARSHVFRLVFGKLREVEIVPTAAYFRGTVHRFLARGEKSEPRRERESLLRSGEEDIDSEFIHRNRNDAEGRDGVDDQAYVRKIAHHACDLLDVTHHAGRRFIVNESDSVKSA